MILIWDCVLTQSQILFAQLATYQLEQTGSLQYVEKRNIGTIGAVNSNGVGARKLSRFDQESRYNDNSTVTETMSIEKMLC